MEKYLGVKLAQVDCQASPKVCDRFGVDAFPSLRVLEGSKTYEYEGQQSSDDVISFIEDRAYRTSSNVVDLLKNKASDIYNKAKEAKPRTAWDHLVHWVNRMIGVDHNSYFGIMAEWLFRAFGFGALSLATKMVGFFLMVIVPIILLLTMYFLPRLMEEKGIKRGKDIKEYS